VLKALYFNKLTGTLSFCLPCLPDKDGETDKVITRVKSTLLSECTSLYAAVAKPEARLKKGQSAASKAIFPIPTHNFFFNVTLVMHGFYFALFIPYFFLFPSLLMFNSSLLSVLLFPSALFSSRLRGREA